MDDADTVWPYWKFGLNKDDLHFKLHDNFNTFPSAIQDPEAFHHDVYEIANEASTTEELYRLLDIRKSQRLDELNKSLEYAACEIIGNPSLIDTERWGFAVQLFRSKALDSLVRFLASYLPETSVRYPVSTSGSYPEADDCRDMPDNALRPFSAQDCPVLTDEPLELYPATAAGHVTTHLPPSPRSMTMSTDSSVPSQVGSLDHNYVFDPPTPTRTLSSSSDSDCDCQDCHSLPLIREEPPQQWAGSEPAILFDLEAYHDSLQGGEGDDPVSESVLSQEKMLEHRLDSNDAVSHVLESEAPTPKRQRDPAPELSTTPCRRHRIASPPQCRPLSRSRCDAAYMNPRKTSPVASRWQKNVDFHGSRKRKRSPQEWSSRVRKLPSNPSRFRPVERGRRSG